MTEPRILNSRYDVGDLIGRGGMADVYHARDLRLGREVAIKLLRRDLARDPVFQTRFRREAQAVAGLNHPAIVAVYDTGEEDVDGSGDHVTKLPYIVMEYVQGKTLRDLSKAGELNLDSSVRYTLGVLAALEYSHRMGIVHRDIKPSNVMVTGDDAVKVMDFGIARAMSDSSATMTQTQAVVGTAQYFSPEQARGETVDARSDLYSAGCLLYELLTGRPPFTGDSPVSVAYQHVSEKPAAASVHNPEISPQIDEVIATALTKDRNDRYQDAAAFSAALRAAQDDRPVPQDLGDATQALALMPLSTQAMLATEPPTQALTSGASKTENDGGDATAAMAATGASGPGDTGRQPAVRDTGSQESLLADGRGSSPTEEAERQRTSRRRAWITVFSILAVIVIALGTWFYWNWSQDQQERNAMIPVPDVSNLSLIDAQNKIYAANLKPVTEEVFDDDADSGSVVGTDPKAGSSARKDSEVQLLVSQGPEQVTLPKDLAGQSEATVRSTLERLGLDVSDDVKRENTATVELGSLIGTNPKLGEKVKTGSLIELTLSTGKVTVPSLTGLSEAEARKVLSDNAVGLELDPEKEESSEPVDSVIEQVPKGGEDLDQGGTVKVKVAIKPPEPSIPPSSESPDESDSKAASESADESSESSEAAAKSPSEAASESAKASEKSSKSPKPAKPTP